MEAEIIIGTEANKKVPITVRLTNTNGYDVKDVAYTLTATEVGTVTGQISDANITLKAGESMTADALLTTKAGQGTTDAGTKPGQTTDTGKNPNTNTSTDGTKKTQPVAAKKAGSSLTKVQTGDIASVVLWIVLAGLAGAVILALLIKRKDLKKFLSLFLCICIMGGILGGFAPSVSAAEPNEENETRGTFTVTRNVMVGGQEVGLNLNVSYPEKEVVHTVTFLDDQDIELSVFSVKDGETLLAENIPSITRDDKAFMGWYLDREAETNFYADDPVTEDLTVYPYFAVMENDTYSGSEFHSEGFVNPDFGVVVLSPAELTTENLSDYAQLTSYFGDIPDITVTPLGDGGYQLSGTFPQKGRFRWSLLSAGLTFAGLEEYIRHYDFFITGEEAEEYTKADDLIDIPETDFITLEETDDEQISNLSLYGASFEVGQKLGIPDGGGNRIYYRVTEILQQYTENDTNKTFWKLQVSPCGLEEIYQSMDIFQQEKDVDQIEDLSDQINLDELQQELNNSPDMQLYADYMTSAINDSPTFQDMARNADGEVQYLQFYSEELNRAAKSNASDALDEALNGLQGIDINKPGQSVSISVSELDVKLEDFNEYWDNRYAEVGEKDPKTGKVVNKGKTDYFGKKFASVNIAITISYEVNSGDKKLTVDATLNFKQYVRVCSSINGKLTISTDTLNDLEFYAGFTAYTESVIGMTVKITTANGDYDITEEIDNVVKSATGEPYSSDNSYVKRFRNIYKGSQKEFVEIFSQKIFSMYTVAGPIDIRIPIKFVVRFGLSAGVGVNYSYRNTYSMGVQKAKGSSEVIPYSSTGEPAWEFNFYVVGHVGVQVGINADVGFSFIGCSKLFQIGLEAEFGFQSNFYGYYMLNIEKTWQSSSYSKKSGGAYYFTAGLYFDLDLYAKLFTIKKEWDIYSWEKELLSAGERYVLLDMKKKDNEKISIVVGKNTPTTKVTEKSGGKTYTFDTLMIDLKPYLESVDVTLMDLRKANEVFDQKKAVEILKKNTTYSATGTLRLPNGKAVANADEQQLYLHPDVWTALRDGKMEKVTGTVTYVYNGPMFAFGETKPSVSFEVELLSEAYLQGTYYDVNYWVGDRKYLTEKVHEGAAVTPYRRYAPQEICDELDIEAAYCSAPTGKIKKNMDVQATIVYKADKTITHQEKVWTADGLEYQDTWKVSGVRAFSDPTGVKPRSSELKEYFVGWDLVGDGSDELNVPVPKDGTEFIYEAVYDNLPEYTVTLLNEETGSVMSEETVTLGEAVTLQPGEVPDDGKRYNTEYRHKSGYCIYAGDRDGTQPLKVYPRSDITVEWRCSIRGHKVEFYANSELYDTQYVDHGDYAKDPLGGEDNWYKLDYSTENGGYYKLSGWGRFYDIDGTSTMSWLDVPIQGATQIHANYTYMGIYHDITLLDEDGITVLYSGKVRDGELLSSMYSRVIQPDMEHNYEMYWKSAADGSEKESATESGTYILAWKTTEREYQITFDTLGITLENGADLPVIDEKIPYSQVEQKITEVLAGRTPVKADTDYETYRYSGIGYAYNPKALEPNGTCTVEFYFEPEAKTCQIEYLADADGKTGSLWAGDEEMELTDGKYTFSMELSEANHTLTIGHHVVANDRNYRFAGWSYDEKIWQVGEQITLTGQEKVKLTAVYEQKPYQVTFDTDGGNLENEHVEVLYAEDGEEIILPTASKSENAQYTYAFTGWKLAGSDTIYTDTFAVTESVTLIAVYTPTVKNYEITFDAAGGTFANGEQAQTISVAYGNVPEPEEPVRTDENNLRYNFNGWNPTLSQVTQAAVYTAMWSTKNLYTLTFDAGDGVFEDLGTSVRTYTEADGADFQLSNVPIPKNYQDGKIRKFMGWSQVEGGSITVTENQTYTAVWSEESILVTGITISKDGKTEDVAAYQAGLAEIEGYELEYIPAEEFYPAYFVLSITGDGLTLSGTGKMELVMYSSNVTLDNLKLAGDLGTFGECSIVVSGETILTATNGLSGYDWRGEDEESVKEKASLQLTGTDEAAKFIVNSIGSGVGVSNGSLYVNNLHMEITTGEEGRYNALGMADSSGLTATYLNNSHVIINRGYSPGILYLKDSDLAFTAETNTGINSYVPFMNGITPPEHLLTLENSQIHFLHPADLHLTVGLDQDTLVEFGNPDGEDEYGYPKWKAFQTEAELTDALQNLSGARLLKKDSVSKILIGNAR